MKIRLSHPALAHDLREFLRRAECDAREEGEGMLTVYVPDAYGDEQARLELDLYLKAWQASHPDVEVDLFEIPQSGVEDAGEPAD